jgi:hypothetical protein
MKGLYRRIGGLEWKGMGVEREGARNRELEGMRRRGEEIQGVTRRGEGARNRRAGMG